MNRKTREDFYCHYSNHIQLFYQIEIYGDDEDDEEITDKERLKSILPDLLNTFQSSFMGKTFPLIDEQFPEGTKAGNHFISFDKDNGIVLCIGVFIDSNILCDTDMSKETLHKLDDEIDGQFYDGWGENGFGFEIDGKSYNCQFNTRNLTGIVAAVRGFSCNFNVKWKNIDDIEHIDWVTNGQNGAFDMLYRPEEIQKEIQARVDMCKELGITIENDYKMPQYNYIKEHLDLFFFR